MKTLGGQGLSPPCPHPPVLSGAIVFFGVLNLPGKNMPAQKLMLSVKDSGEFCLSLGGGGEGSPATSRQAKHDSLGPDGSILSIWVLSSRYALLKLKRWV